MTAEEWWLWGDVKQEGAGGCQTEKQTFQRNHGAHVNWPVSKCYRKEKHEHAARVGDWKELQCQEEVMEVKTYIQGGDMWRRA